MNKKYLKPFYDFIIVLISTILVFLILANIDAFEKFIEFTRDYEDLELDEVLLAYLVFSTLMLWYSYRRLKELMEIKKSIKKDNRLLFKENKKKDGLLENQMKMALLGEMLENIAHQWRQPLTVISTCASGIKVKKQLNIIKDDELVDILDNILTNSKYLSETIDHFRSYIDKNKEKSLFNLNDEIKRPLNILKASFTMQNINIILNLQKDIVIKAYNNDITQVLINILTNSKDAFEQNNIQSRYIFISTKLINENSCQIKIKDSAGGMETKNLKKVFEPYFTTKHKFNGTGLGLYIVYKIINEELQGSINVENCTVNYENEKFKGTCFTIRLPLNY